MRMKRCATPLAPRARSGWPGVCPSRSAVRGGPRGRIAGQRGGFTSPRRHSAGLTAFALGAMIALAMAFAGGAPGIGAQERASGTSYTEALSLFQAGRQLEYAGKAADALARFTASLALCDKGLSAAPGDMEFLVLKCWNLFRLGKHQDVITTGQAALRTRYDPRIEETMGESFYHLGRNEEALQYLSKYTQTASPGDDRLSTAYFYLGETYLRMKKYEHADIAYSVAVHMAPNLPRWWYRLGWVREILGRYRLAYEAYGKAVALSPRYQEAVSGRERVRAKADL